MNRLYSTGRSLMLCAVGTVLAGALSACEPGQAGSAAVIKNPIAGYPVVGDGRITVTDLQDAADDIGVAAGDPTAFTQGNILGWLIVAPFAIDEAARRGVGASQDDARGLLSVDPEHTVAEPSEAGLLATRSFLALTRMQNQLPPATAQEALDSVRSLAETAGIEVNPRYGRFDAEQFTVDLAAPDWIVSTGTPEPSETEPGQAPPQPQPTPTPATPTPAPTPTATSVPTPIPSPPAVSPTGTAELSESTPTLPG